MAEKTLREPDPSLSGIGDKLIFIGWIGALLLLGGLLWFFTQPFRHRITGESVNRILSTREDPRRLGDPLPRGQIRRNLIPLGAWYTLENTPGQALVFPLIAEGGQAPCVAMVSPEGKVETLIPLNGHGEGLLDRLSGEVLDLYLRRIEGSGDLSPGRGAE
jgi:hypothetical protein